MQEIRDPACRETLYRKLELSSRTRTAKRPRRSFPVRALHFLFVFYRTNSSSQADATACRMSQRATTCSSLQPRRLRTWSCSGVRVFLRMEMCKNRLKLIFRMPRLPSTINTSAASRKAKGWLLLRPGRPGRSPWRGCPRHPSAGWKAWRSATGRPAGHQ